MQPAPTRPGRGILVFALSSFLAGGGYTLASAAAPKSVALPEAASAAIKAAYPNATITKAGKETEEGFELYEVALDDHGKKLGVDVAPDGTIIEVEEPTSLAAIPKPAAAALKKLAKGAKMNGVEIATIKAKITKGASGTATLAKLDTPSIVYESDLVKGDERAEVGVSADGTVVESPQWHKARKAAP